jgi:adenylate cyclase
LAALEIRETMAAINREIEADGQRISVGIGIASGEAMAGIFGSPRKKEYTVFGAPVNLASRLENLAAADEIMICENTERFVKDMVDVENVPSAIIRGLTASPEIYRVLSRK